MNLSFSPEDLKFQEEVRSFLKENYPADTKRKMDNGIPLQKEDIQEWQKILSKKGWFAINWPEETSKALFLAIYKFSLIGYLKYFIFFEVFY